MNWTRIGTGRSGKRFLVWCDCDRPPGEQWIASNGSLFLTFDSEEAAVAWCHVNDELHSRQRAKKAAKQFHAAGDDLRTLYAREFGLGKETP